MLKVLWALRQPHDDNCVKSYYPNDNDLTCNCAALPQNELLEAIYQQLRIKISQLYIPHTVFCAMHKFSAQKPAYERISGCTCGASKHNLLVDALLEE